MKEPDTINLPLRPFLTTIEEWCRPLDHESLVQIVLLLAKQVDGDARHNFLTSLGSVLSIDGDDKKEADKKQRGKLMVNIETLTIEILTRIESIEDGSYWEEPEDDDWEEYYYNDEEPEYVNTIQKAALVDFFSEADHYFLQGDKTSAHEVYTALFSLVDRIGGISSLPDFDKDLKETRARFVRCVYELSSRKERTKNILKCMNVSQFEEEFDYYIHNDLPLFQDIIDTDTAQLDDLDFFLSSWKTALSKYDIEQNRVAELLLEVSTMLEGTAGVGKLARKWKGKQPCGYIFWLELLKENERWDELAEIAKEALEWLPPGQERCTAASHMIAAGEKLKKDKVILLGHRESFFSMPREESLVALMTEAGRQGLREKELEKIRSFFAQRKLKYGEKELYAKSLLMAGMFSETFELCKNDEEIGWSSDSTTGLLFASSLYLQIRGNSACTTIQKLLKRYSDSNSIFFCDSNDYIVDLGGSILDEIICGLDNVDAAFLDSHGHSKWASEIGEKRINHIVSNKYRKAYQRAAEVLTSLAELLALSGDKKGAKTLLQEYCHIRYSRHRAFRQEMRKVVGDSQMVGEMIEGL